MTISCSNKPRFLLPIITTIIMIRIITIFIIFIIMIIMIIMIIIIIIIIITIIINLINMVIGTEGLEMLTYLTKLKFSILLFYITKFIHHPPPSPRSAMITFPIVRLCSPSSCPVGCSDNVVHHSLSTAVHPGGGRSAGNALPSTQDQL